MPKTRAWHKYWFMTQIIGASHISFLKFFSLHRQVVTWGFTVELWLHQERPLLLLLLIRDTSGLGLRIPHLTKVNSYGSAGKRIGLGQATVFLIGGSEAADEGIKAAPGLSERASAGTRRFGLSEEKTTLDVDLSLAELVKVAEEVEDMVEITVWKSHRRPLVAKVLSESVPISSFLRLVATQRLRLRLRKMMIGRKGSGRWRGGRSRGYVFSFGGGGRGRHGFLNCGISDDKSFSNPFCQVRTKGGSSLLFSFWVGRRMIQKEILMQYK